MSRPRRITLSIDRLALRGVTPDQRDAVLAALTQEVARRLGAIPAAGLSKDFAAAMLRAELSPDANGAAALGAAAGAQIAGMVTGAKR